MHTNQLLLLSRFVRLKENIAAKELHAMQTVIVYRSQITVPSISMNKNFQT